MDARELRYFVVVAEELHFGRAAERLGIAQPPLSRTISQLERRLGITLLQRTSRSVALTRAGTVLLREGRTALDALEAAEQRTRRSAHDVPRIALAAKAGASSELLAKLVHAYSAEPGSIEVDITLCGPGQQERLLRTGRADVALLHLPFDDATGLDTEELSTEGQVAVLPAGHPLTTRARVDLREITDLPDLPMPRWPDRDGAYPAGPGPEVSSHAQLLQLVALGRTMMIAPESCRAQLHDDLVAIPVNDAPRVTAVIAWPPESRSRHVADLVSVAVSL